MHTTSLSTATARISKPRIAAIWKCIQMILWVIGVAELFLLLLAPQTGLMILWNVLIPAAPALLVLNTGVWRNICPLSTTSLLADKFGLSGNRKLSTLQSIWLNLAGIVLLLIIIPLRHIWFNTQATASAILLIAAGGIAFISGFFFERKSGWCSGACPVHPVEKLYGSGVAETSFNAHCGVCVKCVTPCPDSTPNITVRPLKGSSVSKLNELLLAGCFPGYVWGWFQVPDYSGPITWSHVGIAYGYPLLGAVVTLTLFLLARQLFRRNERTRITSFFGALAISCYYWYRLPMILGFSITENNGAITHLNNVIPLWSTKLLTIATSGFFFWWMVFRKKAKKSWLRRPAYAETRYRPARTGK